jgi:hypothetical protein
VLPLEDVASAKLSESEFLRAAPGELKGVLERGPVHWYLTDDE